MKRQFLIAALIAAAASSSASARADTLCMTVDEFNAYLESSGGTTTTLTLTFDVTGVNPNDFSGSKGCLADLTNTTCTTGAAANVKVYGPYDPPNTSHPAGTLKFEYGTSCCATPPCEEGWADPNASEVIFVDGTEQCDVTVWLNPTDYGYDIDCGGTPFTAVGDNTANLTIDQVAILQLTGGGWAMDNAVSTANQICFEEPVDTPPVTGSDYTAVEDVTAASPPADTVYTDVGDLCSEGGYSEIYLKFDLHAVPGRVTSAMLYLHSSDDGSADGDGGDAYVVPSNDWSELTMTWSSKPATSGSALARVYPVGGFEWFGWDVSAAVEDPDSYSFAIVPQSTDTNGAHFFSKEGSASLAPYLHIEYEVVDGDDDGYPDGPDCDDTSATVHPDATELCNGVDDDCDDTTDEGCSGEGGGTIGPPEGGAGGAGASGGSGASSANDPGDGSSDGCGCRLGAPSSLSGPSGLLAAAALLALRPRARRRR